MRPQIVLFTILSLSPCLSVDADAQGRGRAGIRFAPMDTNKDGVVTRTEWRGSDASFKVHDWNNDGVLSGDELRPGARRPARAGEPPDFDNPDREYIFDDWTAEGFVQLDHNKNNRIARDEWHFDRDAFNRADRNNDGWLSRREFLRGNAGEDDDDREDSFGNLDVNNDRRIARDEWHGTRARFVALDRDGDGFLTRAEAVGTLEPPPDLFTSVDVNRDAAISRDEWHWSRRSFDDRDTNRDGRLTRAEFARGAAVPEQSAAFKAGYARGLIEGRAAGREDRERKQGWDLEGQRELEQADSGYESRFGPREEYQAGYRDAFRKAYREGYGPR
jgi:Ca2+-binding EF-hand superfamily protein